MITQQEKHLLNLKHSCSIAECSNIAALYTMHSYIHKDKKGQYRMLQMTLSTVNPFFWGHFYLVASLHAWVIPHLLSMPAVTTGFCIMSRTVLYLLPAKTVN